MFSGEVVVEVTVVYCGGGRGGAAIDKVVVDGRPTRGEDRGQD